MTEQRTSLEEKILAKAREAAQTILTKERERTESVLAGVRAKGEADLEEALEHAKSRAVMIRKEYEASANLEAKLLALKTKDQILCRVVEEAKRLLEERTGKEDYREVVLRLIQEGLKVLGLDCAIVIVGAQEKRAVGRDWSSVVEAIGKKMGRPVELTLAKEELELPGGVKVMDENHHLLYDNSWNARVERIRPEIGVEVSEILFV